MAQKTISTLAIKVVADAAGVSQGFSRAVTSVQGFSRQVQAAGSSVASALSGWGGQLAALVGAGGTGGLAGWAVSLAADVESAGKRFEVLVGNAEQAGKLLTDLRALSRLPGSFALPDLSKSATTMLSFGLAAQDVLPAMTAIATITSGNNQRFEMLSLAFSQMSAAGRLMGQDLLQMVNAGFNPLQEIIRKTGESLVELKKRMEAGAVSSQEVRDAFISATSEGGRFAGMMEAAASTTQGKWEMLKTQIKTLATEIGETLLPAANKMIESTSELVKWMSGLSLNTLKTVANLVAMGAAFTVTVLVVPRVIAAVASVIAAVRRMVVAFSAAEAIITGGASLAKLALGLAAAGVAVLGVEYAFGLMEARGEEAAKAAAVVKKEINGVTASVAALKKETGSFNFDWLKAPGLASSIDRAGIDQLVSAIERIKAAAPQMNFAQLVHSLALAGRLGEELQQKLAKFGPQLQHEMETPIEAAIRKLRELEAAYKLEGVDDQTYVRAGKKYREDLEKALEAAEKIRDIDKPVGAVMAGSREAFSAAQSIQRDRQREADITARAARIRDKMGSLLAGIKLPVLPPIEAPKLPTLGTIAAPKIAAPQVPEIVIEDPAAPLIPGIFIGEPGLQPVKDAAQQAGDALSGIQAPGIPGVSDSVTASITEATGAVQDLAGTVAGIPSPTADFSTVTAGAREAAAAVDTLALPNFSTPAPAIAGLGKALADIRPPTVDLTPLDAAAQQARERFGQAFVEDIPGPQVQPPGATAQPQLPDKKPTWDEANQTAKDLFGLRDKAAEIKQAGQKFGEMEKAQQAAAAEAAKQTKVLEEINKNTAESKVTVKEATI